MSTGLIILIVTIVAFVAMAVFMLATGFNDQWPEGARYRATLGGHELTLIVSPAAETTHEAFYKPPTWRAVSERFAQALWATAEARRRVKQLTDDRLARAAVLVLTDEEFEAQAPAAIRSSVAYQVTVRRRIGHGPILVVLRANYVEHARKHGEPVIHELLHASGADYHHKDETWWAEHPPSPESVQAHARRLLA